MGVSSISSFYSIISVLACQRLSEGASSGRSQRRLQSGEPPGGTSILSRKEGLPENLQMRQRKPAMVGISAANCKCPRDQKAPGPPDALRVRSGETSETPRRSEEVQFVVGAN